METEMIAIIDYDAGNIKSVGKAFEYIGEEVVLTSDRDEILSADKVILPGVGAFADAMEKLKKHNLINTIYDVVDKKTPFLGICLGLQLLFEDSEEGVGVGGLGILKGHVKRFPDSINMKIPHMGWNSLSLCNNGRLFEGMKQDPYVYFVHSYYLKADDESIVKAKTEYGIEFHASVEKDNVFACQFHPEKSGEAGLNILRNFAKI